MDEGLAALLGAVVGGLTTALATFGFEVRRESVQRRSLAIAVAGEAAAIADVVRRRNWLQYIADYHEAAKRGDVVQLQIQLPSHILQVARSAQQSAGALPGKLPGLVPKLVVLGDGIASDMDRLYRYPVGHPQGFLMPDQPEGAEEIYAELFAVVASALSTCDAIIAEVKRMYPEGASALWSVRTPIEVASYPNGAP